MRTSLWTPVVVGLALGGLACGHDDMDKISDHAETFEEYLADYESQMREHGQVVMDATSLALIQTEESRHRERGEEHMAGMNHEMGDMMGCMGSGGQGPHGAMVWDDLEVMAEEMEAHQGAMLDAGSLEGASVEEARHGDAMADMMSDMRSHVGSMMEEAGDLACPHHGGDQ